MVIEARHVTGLLLAGGRGSRMGGVGKGLQPPRGRALAWHAIERLRPQVGALIVNANRHVDPYAQFGAPRSPTRRPTSPARWPGGRFAARLTCCNANRFSA